MRWSLVEADPDGEPIWGFSLGAYNPSVPLIIDPVLDYVTYVGGSALDSAQAVAVDGDGAAYLTGTTLSSSSSFPDGDGFGGVGGFDHSYNGGQGDAFVVKLAPDGKSMVYATYIGGNDVDEGVGIAVDNNGAAYVAGTTYSSTPSFPITGSPVFDNVYSGLGDAFVAKLAPNGDSLVYATYVGGSHAEIARGIALDGSKAVYLVGQTFSSGSSFPNGSGFSSLFPVVPGFSQSYSGSGDGFVVKLAPNGGSLTYGTFLGGADFDDARAVALDSNHAAYVVGQTFSDAGTFPNGGGFSSLVPAVRASTRVTTVGSGTHSPSSWPPMARV